MAATAKVGSGLNDDPQDARKFDVYGKSFSALNEMARPGWFPDGLACLE
jgi:hypothetical protein